MSNLRKYVFAYLFIDIGNEEIIFFFIHPTNLISREFQFALRDLMGILSSNNNVKSHPIDVAEHLIRSSDREHHYPASLKWPLPLPPFLPVRRSILSPNNFRRLILQFGFARPYAHEITLIRPAHIPAIKRKWALDRPISSRSLLPSSCCDIPSALSTTR